MNPLSRGAAFFWIFFGTLVVTRIFLSITRLESPTVWGFRFHHYMYGLFGMAAAWFTRSPSLFAFSLALFLDEAPMLVWDTKTYDEYLALPSLIGALSFSLPVFFLKDALAGLVSGKQKTAPL